MVGQLDSLLVGLILVSWNINKFTMSLRGEAEAISSMRLPRSLWSLAMTGVKILQLQDTSKLTSQQTKYLFNF